MAVLLTAGTMNAYFAGAAKLGAALGRDGALPGWIARGSVAGEVPRRSLAVMAVLGLGSLVVVAVAQLDVRPLVLLTGAQLATVYAVGIAAAIKLLADDRRLRVTTRAAGVAVVLLLVVTGPYLLWPAALALFAVFFVRRKRLPYGEALQQ
jgi:amino acid efflux transporter